MKKLLLIPLAIILVSALALGGCQKEETTTTTQQPSSTTGQTEEPSGTTTTGETTEPAGTEETEPAAEEEVYTISWAEQNGDNAWGPVHAEIPWMEEITAASNGRIQFDVYYSQTLVKGTDIFNAVKTGMVDGGWCFHGYWADMTPLAEVITLPGLTFTGAKQAGGILWQLYNEFPAMQQEFADVHVLTPWASHNYILITTDKQVKTVDDLNGMKIRTTGGGPTEQMKALGGSPMLIGMPDTYLALEKGTIDGMEAPYEAIQGFRLYEVVQYYTEGAPFPAVFFTYSMNKDKWDSLPPDIQEIFTEYATLEWAETLSYNWFDTAKAGVQEEAAANGNEMIFYDFSQEEIDKMIELSTPVQEQWVADREADGYSEARQILERAQELIETYHP